MCGLHLYLSCNMFLRDIPNLGNGSMEKVLILLKALADISFGDFDYIDDVTAKNLTSTDLGKLEVTDLLKKVSVYSV